MEFNIIDKKLENLSEEMKMGEVKGIVLHAAPDTFNKTIDEIYKSCVESNKENQNYGFHYILDGETIYQTIPTELQAIHLKADKATYISKSLFGDLANEQIISICFIVREQQEYEVTEEYLIRFLVKLLRDNNLSSLDVWRGFDLEKGNYGPFHILSRVIFEKYIKEIQKFIPLEDLPLNNDMDEDVPETDKPAIPDFPTEEVRTPKAPEEDKEPIPDDEIEIVSPFKEEAEKAGKLIQQYVVDIYRNNISSPEVYASNFQPWDKDRADAQIVTTIEGELKTRETPFGNVLQYKITENAAIGSDHCTQPVDHLQAIETAKETMVEPIYPDLITPPGDSVHIADGFSETAVQSDNNTPLTAEELEKRQKTFDFSQFSKMKKETKGRPINVEDPFPVDDQIRKLEEHFPKVKIDKVTFDFKDSNHPNSEIGNAMAKNYAMCYDMVTEIAKRTEQRLVKLENNLSTVMRNLFRLSSRVNVNCVYYGGQSVYGKYKCIRCLHDDRINDGAIVTIDQCMNCTRYEPVLGQVYAILDETGSNIVQVMDDLQMSYMELEDYKNLTSVSDYHEEVPHAKVNQHPSDKPTPFIDGKWKDTEEEQEEKRKAQEAKEAAKEEPSDKSDEEVLDKEAAENITAEEATKDKAEEDKEKEPLPNGFKMDWNPVMLEVQEPHINKYDTEKLKAEKTAVGSDAEGIDREIYTDSREDAVENERLEFNVSDYAFDDFGNSSSGSYTPGIGFAQETRNKIMQYVKDAIQLCSEGKAKYSRDYRYNHYEKAIDGISYWDCSSLVQRAYEAACIAGIGTNTKTIFPYCLDTTGGLLIPIANETEAIPGDIIWFTDQKPIPEQTREGLQEAILDEIGHVGIYMGDGKYGHSSYAHEDSTKDIVIAEISANKKAFAFARPKALIELDAQFGQGLSGNEHWSREFHGITDEWWNAANVVDGQVQLLAKNMEKYGYKDSMIKISQEKGFDPYLTAAIITVESTGDPRDNDKYAGLMQVHGHYGTTELAGMEDNIRKGIDMILAKKKALLQRGWTEDNIHVLVSAYNSGEGTVRNAAKASNVNLSTCKIPEMGNALHSYVSSNNPSWNANEKKYYAVKILRAYNLIYSQNILGLPQQDTNNPAVPNIPGGSGDLIRPLPVNYNVSSNYGYRIHPMSGKIKFHTGVDISAPGGVPIVAVAAGKVVKREMKSTGYGYRLDIDHGNGLSSLYAHMSAMTVMEGQTVKQGQEIGKVGTTGSSTGNHLHFELRKNGSHFNPADRIGHMTKK